MNVIEKKLATMGAEGRGEKSREVKRLENLERKRRLKCRRVLYPTKREHWMRLPTENTVGKLRPVRRRRDTDGNKIEGYE